MQKINSEYATSLLLENELQSKNVQGCTKISIQISIIQT